MAFDRRNRSSSSLVGVATPGTMVQGAGAETYGRSLFDPGHATGPVDAPMTIHDLKKLSCPAPCDIRSATQYWGPGARAFGESAAPKPSGRD